MFDNFEMTSKQLSELSKVLNGFKSEAVQLRIVDHLFKSALAVEGLENAEVDVDTPVKSKRRPKRKTPNKAKNEAPSNVSTPSRSRKEGPKAVLTKLVDEGFFVEPKQIGHIQSHCKDSLARNFKTSDLSPTLGRLIKDRILTREKNLENGQYEYFAR